MHFWNALKDSNVFFTFLFCSLLNMNYHRHLKLVRTDDKFLEMLWLDYLSKLISSLAKSRNYQAHSSWIKTPKAEYLFEAKCLELKRLNLNVLTRRMSGNSCQLAIWWRFVSMKPNKLMLAHSKNLLRKYLLNLGCVSRIFQWFQTSYWKRLRTTDYMHFFSLGDRSVKT